MAIRETLAPMFQMIWGTAQRNAEAMPEGEMEFRPDGLETRSFREIALHMANSNVLFGENIGKTTWERVLAYAPDQVRAKRDVLDAMRQSGERFLANLRRLTEDEERRTVTTPWGAQMPQGAVVAGQVPHLFYHNGQLTIYLRMRGIKPLFLAP